MHHRENSSDYGMITRNHDVFKNLSCTRPSRSKLPLVKQNIVVLTVAAVVVVINLVEGREARGTGCP